MNNEVSKVKLVALGFRLCTMLAAAAKNKEATSFDFLAVSNMIETSMETLLATQSALIEDKDCEDDWYIHAYVFEFGEDPQEIGSYSLVNAPGGIMGWQASCAEWIDEMYAEHWYGDTVLMLVAGNKAVRFDTNLYEFGNYDGEFTPVATFESMKDSVHAAVMGWLT